MSISLIPVRAANVSRSHTRRDTIASIAVHLLGRPRIEIGGKAWGLLAFILMSRLPASRESLATLAIVGGDMRAYRPPRRPLT